jgi:hypothetical protein
VVENKGAEKIFGANRAKVIRVWRKMSFIISLNIVRIIKSRRMRRVWY